MIATETASAEKADGSVRQGTHLDIATWIFGRDPDEVRPA
jgi:hypothetical protein